MSEQTAKNAKVLFGGSEGILHVTDKSILFENEEGEITGIEKSAIRMVKTNGDNELVVAYADGSNVKSVRIKPLEGDVASLLVQVGSKESITPAVFDEQFERIYQYWKTKLEAALKQSIKGRPYRLEHEEKSQISNAFIEMEALLLGKLNMSGHLYDTRIWRLRETPEEFQIGWAKATYISHFLPTMIEVASGYHYLYRNHQPRYVDFEGMWPEDWERFFLHYGIIEKQILTEEQKMKAREGAEVVISQATVKKDGPPPDDYKSWF